MTAFSVYAVAQSSSKKNTRSQPIDSSKTSILQRKDIPTSYVNSSDSTRSEADTTKPVGTTTPGEYPFTPEQDKAFYEAMQVKIPASMRFQADAQRFSQAWMALQELRRKDPMATAFSNMSVPASMYIPTAREQTAYDYGIAQSFTIPGIYEPFKGGGVGKGNGLHIPLSLIGQLLGLVEDVSPTFSYSVEQPSAEVEVIVYSVQARSVAHIVKTRQNEGSYTMTWNLKNDAGLPVPRGDYIAETRISNTRIFRKRIRVE